MDAAYRGGKGLAKPVESAIVPACDAAALTMQARAERHVERMAGITDRVLPHLESMEPAEILNSARNLERFDYVATAQLRIGKPTPSGWANQSRDFDQPGDDRGEQSGPAETAFRLMAREARCR